MLTLKASSIIIGERLRTEMDEKPLKDLARSMMLLGQLQPIVVIKRGEDYVLDVGERRIRAVLSLAKEGKSIKNLEAGLIRATLLDDAPEYVRLQRENDENEKREDFNFVDRARFIRRFHEAAVEHARKDDLVWPQSFTAAALGLNPASISNYLRIEEAVKEDPFVAKAATIQAAVKRIKIQRQLEVRKKAAEKNETSALKRARDILVQGDCLVQIESLVKDNSISLVNFDPPWGDETGRKSNQNWIGGGAFADDTENSDHLINTLLPILYRKMADNSFLIYWYRTWAYHDMCLRLEAAGFHLKFGRTPAIWYKPDKVSDQNRFPEKQLLDQYETFLIARKGEPVYQDRNLGNVFEFSRVPISDLIHPTEKPLGLMETLVSLCTIPGELVFDPTAGSSSFLHAAILKKRKCIGIELNQKNYERSLLRLTDAMKMWSEK